MAIVRRNLDQRWKDGKAAAIYLKGHADTVYCVQFDEYVDIPYLVMAISDSTITDTRSSLGPAIARFAFGMLITRGHVLRLLAHLLHINNASHHQITQIHSQ